MEAVQRSCRAVADRPVRLAEVFYRHLFEMAPATRALFAADMSEQMQKMTDTLLTAITQLLTYDTADLEVTLHRLGREHYDRYGVEPDHYLYIAHALNRAVRDVAGWDYTSYLSSCWIALSQWVTRHMITGARAAMAVAAAAHPADGGSEPAPPAVVPGQRATAPSPSRRSTHRRPGTARRR